MSLADWLKQEHGLPEQLRIIEGLCTTLMEAHKRGVHHRAIKPAHIDVRGDGGVRLMDLALRGEPDRPGPAETREAAATYAAPEVLEKSLYSTKADIYSLGVILYEILAGRHPFVVETHMGNFEAVTNLKPPALADVRPDLSGDLSDAIMICLDSDPEWRPPDMSYVLNLVRGLRSIAESARPQGKAAPRSGPPPGRAGEPSRGRLPWVISGVALAAGVGTAGWWWWTRPGAEPRRGQGGSGAVTVATPPATLGAGAMPAPELPPPPSQPGASPSTAVRLPADAPAAEASLAPSLGIRPSPAPASSSSPTPEPHPMEPAPAPTPDPPPPDVSPTPEPPAPLPPPMAPATLKTVSPLALKRGWTRILDVRGQGLRPDHQAEILRGGAPAGDVHVARMRFVDATLIQVVVAVDASAASGSYEIVLSDPGGGRTNRLSFHVER